MRNNTETPVTEASRTAADPRTVAFVTILGFTLRVGVLRLRDRAVELQLHPMTLKRQIKAGKLKACRIGDLLYLSETQVADWLKSTETGRKAA